MTPEQTRHAVSKAKWRCTYMSKEVEEDKYNEGCVGPRSYVYERPMRLEADTLKVLIEMIKAETGLYMDDLFLPIDDEGVTSIGFNRLENNDAEEPSKSDLKRWKKGALTLYLADYHFIIERSCTIEFPITIQDFDAAGIKHH